MGLFDHLFKSKSPPSEESSVQSGAKPAEPAKHSDAARGEQATKPDPSAFLHPKNFVPRGISPAVVAPGKSGAISGVRKPGATSSSPAVEEIVLTLGDVLSRIPAPYLRAGQHDPKRELRFNINDLSSDIARGRAAVPLSRIAQLVPDIFVKKIGRDEDTEIRLPLQKLVEQIGLLRSKPGSERTARPATGTNTTLTPAVVESKASPPSISLEYANPGRETLRDLLTVVDPVFELKPADHLATSLSFGHSPAIELKPILEPSVITTSEGTTSSIAPALPQTHDVEPAPAPKSEIAERAGDEIKESTVVESRLEKPEKVTDELVNGAMKPNAGMAAPPVPKTFVPLSSAAELEIEVPPGLSEEIALPSAEPISKSIQEPTLPDEELVDSPVFHLVGAPAMRGAFTQLGEPIGFSHGEASAASGSGFAPLEKEVPGPASAPLGYEAEKTVASAMSPTTEKPAMAKEPASLVAENKSLAVESSLPVGEKASPLLATGSSVKDQPALEVGPAAAGGGGEKFVPVAEAPSPVVEKWAVETVPPLGEKSGPNSESIESASDKTNSSEDAASILMRLFGRGASMPEKASPQETVASVSASGPESVLPKSAPVSDEPVGLVGQAVAPEKAPTIAVSEVVSTAQPKENELLTLLRPAHDSSELSEPEGVQRDTAANHVISEAVPPLRETEPPVSESLRPTGERSSLVTEPIRPSVENPAPVVTPVPKVMVQETPEPSDVGGEKIQLSLAALLRQCPKEIIVGELPTVPDHIRITLPFAPIDRQLVSGRVEISAVRFVAAIPFSYQKYFSPLLGIKVPIPLEEVFQNLPNPAEQKPEPVAPSGPVLAPAAPMVEFASATVLAESASAAPVVPEPSKPVAEAPPATTIPEVTPSTSAVPPKQTDAVKDTELPESASTSLPTPPPRTPLDLPVFHKFAPPPPIIVREKIETPAGPSAVAPSSGVEEVAAKTETLTSLVPDVPKTTENQLSPEPTIPGESAPQSDVAPMESVAPVPQFVAPPTMVKSTVDPVVASAPIVPAAESAVGAPVVAPSEPAPAPAEQAPAAVLPPEATPAGPKPVAVPSMIMPPADLKPAVQRVDPVETAPRVSVAASIPPIGLIPTSTPAEIAPVAPPAPAAPVLVVPPPAVEATVESVEKSETVKAPAEPAPQAESVPTSVFGEAIHMIRPPQMVRPMIVLPPPIFGFTPAAAVEAEESAPVQDVVRQDEPVVQVEESLGAVVDVTAEILPGVSDTAVAKPAEEPISEAELASPPEVISIDFSEALAPADDDEPVHEIPVVEVTDVPPPAAVEELVPAEGAAEDGPVDVAAMVQALESFALAAKPVESAAKPNPASVVAETPKIEAVTPVVPVIPMIPVLPPVIPSISLAGPAVASGLAPVVEGPAAEVPFAIPSVEKPTRVVPPGITLRVEGHFVEPPVVPVVSPVVKPESIPAGPVQKVEVATERVMGASAALAATSNPDAPIVIPALGVDLPKVPTPAAQEPTPLLHIPGAQADEEATEVLPPPALPFRRFSQDALQALFMTEEILDLTKISRMAAQLPGVHACVIATRDQACTGGTLPEGFDLAALLGLAPRVGEAAGRMPIGDLKHFTLYGEHYSVSFFARNGLSLCAVHRPRSFVPGVREKLVAIADELSK